MIARDKPEHWTTTSRRLLGTGAVSSFVEDEIVTPSGEPIVRQYLTHPGAVAIVAWNEADEIAVVDQYRQPVRHRLVEIPAGLLDHEGEDFLGAAARELAEEAQLAADDWRVLVDIYTSPGASEEGLRIYLARDLRSAPMPDGFVVEGEEAHMHAYWLPRETLLAGIYAGEFGSPSLVSGVLALEGARLAGRLDALRPADAPWPSRTARDAS